jgi:hypothetical protein
MLAYFILLSLSFFSRTKNIVHFLLLPYVVSIGNIVIIYLFIYKQNKCIK